MAVRGTEDRLKERRHAQADIDSSIRQGLVEALSDYEKTKGGQGNGEDGGVLQAGGREEPELEERADEPAGSEAELGRQEEESRVHEDSGSVGEEEGHGEEETLREGEAGRPREGAGDEGREGSEGEEEEVKLLAGELEPPDFWPGNIKEEFKRMPRKSQEFYLNSYKGMQADYTQKMQSIAEVHRAIDPVREDLTKTGVSEGEMIRRFVAVHKRLEEDPQKAIKWIADLYGVPVEVRGAAVEDDEPPKVKELSERIRVQEMTQALERARSINTEIEHLKASGKMPLYAEAEPVMMRLVAMARAAGQPLPPLMELYEQAVWVTPQLRERHLAHKSAADAKAKLEETKKDVAKAKRAVGKTDGASAEPAPKKRRPTTLRDELSARYDEAMRRRG